MKTFTADENGVAVVIGAILVTALLVAMFVNVRLTYVPAWEKENEVEHLDTVLARLADLKHSVEAPQDNSSATGLTLSLPMRPAKALLAASAPQTHRLDLVPGGRAVHIQADPFLPAADGSPDRDAFSEAWTPIAGTLHDVDALHNFRLRLDHAGGSNAYGHVRIIARDASGNWAGNFSFVQPSGGDSVVVRVTDAEDQTVYDNPVLTGITGGISPFWVDVLEPQYRFGGLIERAVAPVSLEFERVRLNGDYTIAYTTSSGTGVATDPASTRGPVELNRTFEGGALVYHGSTSRMVQQTITFENGAIVVEQDDGAALHTPPAFHARWHNDLLFLTAALPSIGGPPASVSGAPESILQVAPTQSGGTRGLTDAFTLNVTTAWPSLWAETWERALRAVPELEDLDYYEITTGPDWARLQVTGASDDLGHYDIFLSLHQRSVHVELGGP